MDATEYYYALVTAERLVTQVLVLDTPAGEHRPDTQEYLDQQAAAVGGYWVRTDPRDGAGLQRDDLWQPTGEPALRGNFASPGWLYDSDLDIFLPPRPYASWQVDAATASWHPPIPQPLPTESHYWVWNESALSWDAEPFPPKPGSLTAENTDTL